MNGIFSLLDPSMALLAGIAVIAGVVILAVGWPGRRSLAHFKPKPSAGPPEEKAAPTPAPTPTPPTGGSSVQGPVAAMDREARRLSRMKETHMTYRQAAAEEMAERIAFDWKKQGFIFWSKAKSGKIEPSTKIFTGRSNALIMHGHDKPSALLLDHLRQSILSGQKYNLRSGELMSVRPEPWPTIESQEPKEPEAAKNTINPCPWCASHDIRPGILTGSCFQNKCQNCGCYGPRGATTDACRELWNDLQPQGKAVSYAETVNQHRTASLNDSRSITDFIISLWIAKGWTHWITGPSGRVEPCIKTALGSDPILVGGLVSGRLLLTLKETLDNGHSYEIDGSRYYLIKSPKPPAGVSVGADPVTAPEEAAGKEVVTDEILALREVLSHHFRDGKPIGRVEIFVRSTGKDFCFSSRSIKEEL